MSPLLAPTYAQNPLQQVTGSEDQAADEEQKSSVFDEPILSEEGLFEPAYWAGLGRRFADATVEYMPRLFAALLLLVIFWVISRVAVRVFGKTMSRSRADPAVKHIVGKLLGVAILVIGTLMALTQAGLPVGSLLASVGVIGLAVGLAAQDSLSNVIAGLIILWDRPFRVGHQVTIADEYGTVTAVGLRTTTIETVRKLEAILPNSEVISSKIINHTRTPQLRIDVPVGIAYGESIDAARNALLDRLNNHDLVDPQREPAVIVSALGDSSVNLELRVWLKDGSTERPALWEFTELAKKALDDAGIEIPFPQRTLHIVGHGAKEAEKSLQTGSSEAKED